MMISARCSWYRKLKILLETRHGFFALVGVSGSWPTNGLKHLPIRGTVLHAHGSTAYLQRLWTSDWGIQYHGFICSPGNTFLYAATGAHSYPLSVLWYKCFGLRERKRTLPWFRTTHITRTTSSAFSVILAAIRWTCSGAVVAQAFTQHPITPPGALVWCYLSLCESGWAVVSIATPPRQIPRPLCADEFRGFKEETRTFPCPRNYLTNKVHSPPPSKSMSCFHLVWTGHKMRILGYLVWNVPIDTECFKTYN